MNNVNDSDNISDIDDIDNISDISDIDDINDLDIVKYKFVNRKEKKIKQLSDDLQELNKYMYINSNGEYEINYKCNTEKKQKKEYIEKERKFDLINIGKIELPIDENIIMKELIDTDKKGVYVCRMTNGKYYVGKSINIKNRLEDHLSFIGGSIWTRSEKIISLLQPIVEEQSDILIWEQLETIARMKIHGLENVRGGIYTSINILSKRKISNINNCIERIFGNQEIKIDEQKYLVKKNQIKDKLIHNDGYIIMDKNVNIKKAICVIYLNPVYYVHKCSDLSKYLNKLYEKHKNIIIYYPITKRLPDEDIKEWCKREVLIRILFHGFGLVYGGCYRRYFLDDKLRDKVYNEISNLFD